MVIGAVCIVLSLIVCFGITPLFNAGLKAQTDIVRVKADISRGDKINDSMIEVISVGSHNLPADVVKARMKLSANTPCTIWCPATMCCPASSKRKV